MIYPVHIVGIGTGNPELLTVAAYRALAEADVVVYDSLQAFELLSICKSEVVIEKLNKQKNQSSKPVLDQIVDMLELHYRAGKKVVRLKVGDALVFGRGATEMSAVRQRGIDVRVIPGITAAGAIAAAFGVRLTEKGESDTLTYYMAANFYDNPKWVSALVPILKQGGTIAVYMGLHCIADLASALVDMGVDAQMPVGVVAHADMPNQIQFMTTLRDVHAKVIGSKISEPVIFYLGSFVKFTLNID